MTVAQAAERWRELKPEVRELQLELSQCEDVLKEHFRSRGTTVYKRLISYACSSYRRLDTKLARAELGAKALDCEVEVTKETLTAL
jgi:hypothetical protein